MFNKQISGPLTGSYLDLWARTWWCKCLTTCTCITLPYRYSCGFSGHHPLRVTILLFCFVFLTHSCLLYPPHLTRTFGPLSTKQFIFLVHIWHITIPGLALTSHVVKSVHHNSHIALLTSVQEPPRFACLCRTDSWASAAIYPVHGLVCLRAFCSIHTIWMTFRPLSSVSTGGTTCSIIIGLPHWSFI